MRVSLLEKWLEEKNIKELRNCKWMMDKSLRQWGSVHKQMDSNKDLSMWKDSAFVAIYKEYNKLLKISVKVDKFLEKTKNEVLD